MRRSFGLPRGGRKTRPRRAASWRWRWFMTGAREARPRGRRAHGATGVTLRIVRDWVLKFNAIGPDGLIDRKAPGQPLRLDDTHRLALAAVIESGPIPAVHGVRPKGGQTDVVRWRLVDLAQWLWDEFRVSIAKQTLSREVRALDYCKLSARPRHHAQAADAIPAFKKTLPPRWQRSGRSSRLAHP